MLNNPSTSGILLDTSFIMPTLGFTVDIEVDNGMKRLNVRTDTIYYADLSLLEASWIAAKHIRNRSFDKQRFRSGMLSITTSGRYHKAEPQTSAYEEALTLYGLGHGDMIDNLLYTISRQNRLLLLTIDGEFGDFIRDNGLVNVLLRVDQL